MSAPKRIFLISNTSWSFVKFRAGLIVALVSDGFHVTLLAPPDEESQTFKTFGAEYIPLRYMNPQSTNPVSDLLFMRELRAIYKQQKPDLVIQYTIKPNIYSSIVCRTLGIPNIAVVTGLGYTYIRGGWVSEISNMLYRYAFKRASEVWFLNHDDLRVFVEKKIVDKRKTMLIPGEGINTGTKFNPNVVSTQISPENESIRFLFVGRLLYDKGIREYVAAAEQIKARYKHVHFNILGYLNVKNPSAVQADLLQTWTKGGIVEYLGHVDDVRPVVMAHDCLVLPSYREGMSTTLQEAAALARPLIATDIPGCKELIDNGVNGYICRVRDVPSLVEEMERFIQLPVEKRREMGLNGRRKMISEFSEERVFQIYRDHINVLLNNGYGS